MKSICISIFLLLTCHIVFGQSKFNELEKEQFKNQFTEYMQELDLTDAQAEKFNSINEVYFKDLRGMKNTSLSKFAKYRKYKSLKSKRNKKMKGVLSDDQYKRFIKLQDQIKRAFKDRMN